MLQPQQPPPGLTPQQRMAWNLFIDYLDKQGLKGSPLLDQKDKNLGQYQFQKFASLNPGLPITYNDVPKVQQELQEYRNAALQKWKDGKIAIDGVKTEDDFMPGLSQVDGWLGSKTSSYKYPGDTESVTRDGNTKTTNYGASNFDAVTAQLKNK